MNVGELKAEEGDEGSSKKRPSSLSRLSSSSPRRSYSRQLSASSLSSLSSPRRSAFKSLSHSGDEVQGENKRDDRKRPSSLSRLSSSPRRNYTRQNSSSNLPSLNNSQSCFKRISHTGEIIEGELLFQEEQEEIRKKLASSLSNLYASPRRSYSRQLGKRPSSLSRLPLSPSATGSLRSSSISPHRSHSRQLGKRPASLSRLSRSPSSTRRSYSRQLGNRPASLSRLSRSPSSTRRSLSASPHGSYTRQLGGSRTISASLPGLPLLPSHSRSPSRPRSESSLSRHSSRRSTSRRSNRSQSSNYSTRKSASRSRGSGSRGRSKTGRSLSRSSCHSGSRAKSRSSRRSSRTRSRSSRRSSRSRRNSLSSRRHSDTSLNLLPEDVLSEFNDSTTDIFDDSQWGLQTVHSDNDDEVSDLEENRNVASHKGQRHVEDQKSRKPVISEESMVPEDQSKASKRGTMCIVLSALLCGVVAIALIGIILGFRSSSVSPARDIQTESPEQLVSNAPTTPSPSISPTRRIVFDPPNSEDCLNMAAGNKVAGQDDMIGRNFTVAISTVVKYKALGPDLESILQKSLQEYLIPKMADCPNVSRHLRQRRLALDIYAVGGGFVDVQCLDEGSCESTSSSELCYSCLLTLELLLKDDSVRNLDLIGKISVTMLQEDFVGSIGLDGLLVSMSTLGVELGSPTDAPSPIPSQPPSLLPSNVPSARPSSKPTRMPITDSPSQGPTKRPASSPTKSSTISPSKEPTLTPTMSPTLEPTSGPTSTPTRQPTPRPSPPPTPVPLTPNPTLEDSVAPTAEPSRRPTPAPTSGPTPLPTSRPSNTPSSSPSSLPTLATTETDNDPSFFLDDFFVLDDVVPTDDMLVGGDNGIDPDGGDVGDDGLLVFGGDDGTIGVVDDDFFNSFLFPDVNEP